MHDNSILILLLMLIALSVNIIVWIFKDMEQDKRANEEIEHWLSNGQSHSKQSHQKEK